MHTGQSSFDNISDTELWREFKQGNRYALIRIYNRYFDDLYNYAYQFTADVEKIEDHLQDMFVELFYNKNKLSDTNNIRFYLYKVLKRKILNEQKKIKKLKLDYAKNEVGQSFMFEFSVEQKLVDEQAEIERNHKLESAIKMLKPEQREALFYFYHDGLTLDQIADIMGYQNIKSIQNVIYRAINNIRKALIVLLLMILVTFF